MRFFNFLISNFLDNLVRKVFCGLAFQLITLMLPVLFEYNRIGSMRPIVKTPN